MLPAKKTVSSVMSGLMSNPAVKSRFNEILGKRSNKFVSALISLLNADQNLSQAFISDPMSVLQVALKAATFNMPIGNDLGFAYIIIATCIKLSTYHYFCSTFSEIVSIRI